MATKHSLDPSAGHRRSEARSGRCRPSGAAAAPHDPSLSTLVACEVIPRLMAASPVRRPDPAADIGSEDIEGVVSLALTSEADVVIERIESLMARGLSADAVLIDLLAPAARILGEYWEEDRCDFVDVTMALWRLQQTVESLQIGMANEPRCSRRALFSPAPGDDHGFGAVIVEQMFLTAGWTTRRIIGGDRSEMLQALATGWFDIAGLTVGCTCNTARLASTITAMRSVSHNPGLKVLLGGPALIANADIVDLTGADGTAPDARQAVALADRLVEQTEARSLRPD